MFIKDADVEYYDTYKFKVTIYDTSIFTFEYSYLN